MKYLSFILFLLLGTVLHAQQTSSYYASPLQIPLLLNGSFAELRNDHFHSGVDFKTQGKTGLPVYAVADGYVSRIKVSPTGFGQAVYIDHPNGTTSVYGHLEKFIPKIESYVREHQYKMESFPVDLTVPKNLFPVKKGAQIAWSGNSGSSAGPHLHFEIRNTVSQKTLNPLLYHLPVTDHIKPKILSVMVYPVSDSATVYGKQSPKRFETVFYDGAYHIKSNPVIPVSGKIGFGLQAIDYMNGSWSKCGISGLQLKIDNEPVFSFHLDSFSFDQTRYINSFLDYEQAVQYQRRLYKTWLEPGNKLDVYQDVIHQGLLTANDGKKHLIRYEITDSYGNLSILKFAVAAVPSTNIQTEDNGILFPFNKTNSIDYDSIELIVPQGALYSDLHFIYKEESSLPGTYSKVFGLHNNQTPLHLKCPLKIKVENLPDSIRSKAVLTKLDPNSGEMIAERGHYENGWVIGQIRTLGDYTVTVDTVPPEIIPVNITARDTLSRRSSIRFVVKDDFSGIKSYRGTIDGQWVLFEYDPRKDILSYTLDRKRVESSKQHKLMLEVEDEVGNQSRYESAFYW